MEKITDMEHYSVLGKHAVCNSINGFTHFEYYKEADVKVFIKMILEKVPDQEVKWENELGDIVYSTTHKEIKKLAGTKLTDIPKP